MTTQRSNSHQNEDDCESNSLSIDEINSKKDSSETNKSGEGPEDQYSKEDEAIL